ncbi:MAG: metal-dependent hydrolase [Burkholderiales bacterium]
MIIAHLPAGYLCSRLLCGRFKRYGCSRRAFIAAGMLGSIAPDLDMLYFHLVDGRQHHHHTYWSHYPVVWIVVLGAMTLWLLRASRQSFPALGVVFAINGMLHLLLDSIVGDIWWFAPWVDRSYALFTVPSLYKPWWVNFLLHWSFALEIGVVLWAGVLLWHSRTAAGGMQQTTRIYGEFWH